MTADPHSRDALERSHVGAYRLLRKLGGGGMGVVYAAEAPDGRRVAVKTLRTGERQGQEIERFRREALIRIDDPRVVEVLDSGVDTDGTPYIVLELLEGQSLDERLKAGGLDVAEVVRIGIEASRALAAVHGAGIVHRDLKPANLFCCSDRRVKLLDFGIARVAEGETKLTTEGMLIGTLSYLSPEQARGAINVDARTDVWALGAVLFEMIEGVAPFDRPSMVATLMAILNEPAPLLTGVPAALAQTVARCLRRQPADRWPDARALTSALEAVNVREGSASISIAPRMRGKVSSTDATRVAEPSMRTDEMRFVAVMLAREVQDMPTVEHEIGRAGGQFFALLTQDAVGLFGAERWEGDEVRRAVAAALRCRPFAGAVAVGSGRVQGTAIGIAGDALSEVERACAVRAPGVALQASTARMLRDAYALRERSDGLWEALGEHASNALPSSDDGEIVGRTVELAQIRAMVEAAFGQQRATLVSIVGPPGIGKSRVRRAVSELVRACDSSARVLLGRGEPLHANHALALWTSILAQRLTEGAQSEDWPRLDSDSPTAANRAVEFLAVEAVGDATRARECALLMAELLGVGRTSHGEAPRDEVRLLADRFRLALLDFVGGHCARGPVALLVDDLQWVDPQSIELLLHVLEQLRDEPLFVLLTTRDGGNDLARSAALRLSLRGLAESDVARLAAHVAGRAVDTQTVAVLARRTEGNPLFVEQLVLDLADQRRLHEDPDSLPLPLTVEAAVQSRLDHLPEMEKELCKRLSVFGRPATADELAALGPLDDATVSALASREIWQRQRPSARRDAPAYAFRSPLMAEVTYRTIAPAVRAELHSQIGRALAERPDLDPEEVASHLERGGSNDAALGHYLRAVSQAARRGDSASVLRCSDAALAIGVAAADLFELHLARAEALRFLARRDDEAHELALALEAAKGERECARALIEQTVWSTRTARVHEALDIAALAVEAAETVGDPELVATSYVRRAEALTYGARHEEAETELARAASMAPALGTRLRAILAEQLALVAAHRGDIGTSWEQFRAAADLFEQSGDERRAAGTLANIADAHNRVGRYEEATRALEHAIEGCRRVGNRFIEGYALLNLAYAKTALGAPSESLPLLESAEAIAAHADDDRLRLWSRLYRGRALAALGRGVEANEIAANVINASRAAEHQSTEVGALALAARCALERGDVSAALEASGRAVATRDALGGVLEDEAEIFVVRSLALAAAGRHEEAAEIRRRGRARLEEVAAHIRDPIWRAAFLEGPPAHRALFAGP